ncbi:MAG: helix-turn-helix domain-containing protein [Alphaproteobacteria bacterium]|nr:helix-turn-helix domain-containing protein [Alphaproteobacteria bacterium]MBU1512700.1 helix-turn-helix domain-containing protein [Alphaproteobacteria bacterium]MBU2096289.1 helix-turn-helix domain-containing protein [Alphaproteobacteria bacterium]MBU2152435.1 helix-turn-helix domain-containing protein [Alphaproteobacteria bacterium]MBU2308032.1 helix-turn-helix domain-containing protein [Alphaproteobacteria bacterium]
MPSFQLTITPSRRAAARHINNVRRSLQKAFAREAAEGLTQSEIARRLDVHRSVINKELRGAKDITHGRVGELAYAMGYEPHFELRKVQAQPGVNMVVELSRLPTATASSPTWPTAGATVVFQRVLKAVA